MKMNFRGYALRSVAVMALVSVCSSFALTQDPDLKPEYGSKDLNAGFLPDPLVVNVLAGGDIKSEHGGVTQYVAKAPDFRVNYKAGAFSLTFYAECKEDATLLINMPDGKTWLANDDGPGTGLNPLIKIQNPPSGQYDIWVGTLSNNVGTPPAKLFVTELK